MRRPVRKRETIGSERRHRTQLRTVSEKKEPRQAVTVSKSLEWRRPNQAGSCQGGGEGGEKGLRRALDLPLRAGTRLPDSTACPILLWRVYLRLPDLPVR